VGKPQPIWRPSARAIESSQLTAYMAWLKRDRGLDFNGYDDLWRWSVEKPDEFWQSIWTTSK